MCFKGLKKEEPVPFDYDFRDWSSDCLELNREVVEETIKEAHSRENVIYSRVGSLLALNGVILAVVCTLISRSNMATDSVPAYLLATGICVLIFSVLILGYLLIPPTRTIVDPRSCGSDQNYYNNHKDDVGLQKIISGERIGVCENIRIILKTMSVYFSLAIISSAAGLGLIGFALISSMVNNILAMLLCSIMTMAIIWFSILYWKRAKV